MDIQTALDGLTVEEQINLIDKENFSGGDIEEACFWSLGVFAFFHFSEIVRKPFGKHHDKFFNAIPPRKRGKKVNIIAPRGSAKSTILAVIYPLHCIVYKEIYESIGTTSDRFILIVSRNYATAADRVRDIRANIEKKIPKIEGQELEHRQNRDLERRAPDGAGTRRQSPRRALQRLAAQPRRRRRHRRHGSAHESQHRKKRYDLVE